MAFVACAPPKIGARVYQFCAMLFRWHDSQVQFSKVECTNAPCGLQASRDGHLFLMPSALSAMRVLRNPQDPEVSFRKYVCYSCNACYCKNIRTRTITVVELGVLGDVCLICYYRLVQDRMTRTQCESAIIGLTSHCKAPNTERVSFCLQYQHSC